MEKTTDSPKNQSSENVAASDQIESEIATPPDEREAASGSNDAHQGKTKECTTLPSCFTMDDRSGQTQSLAGTSSKVHNECKYSYLFHLKKRVLFVLGTLYE